MHDREKQNLDTHMIVIPATIESIQTRRDRTISIRIGSQEMTPEKGGQLFRLQNKLGFMAFSESTFQPDEIEALTNIDSDMELIGKTPSERLRNTLFVAFQQGNEGFANFDAYYRHKMEKFIDHVKTKLLPKI